MIPARVAGQGRPIDNDNPPRAWLKRPCPTCKVRAHFACRDADGYFANTHEARMTPGERAR